MAILSELIQSSLSLMEVILFDVLQLRGVQLLGGAVLSQTVQYVISTPLLSVSVWQQRISSSSARLLHSIGPLVTLDFAYTSDLTYELKINATDKNNNATIKILRLLYITLC